MSLYGDAKVGKSFAAMQLAIALSYTNHHDWLSFPVERQGPVVYVQLDTPRSVWLERLEDEIHVSDAEMRGVWMADRETLQAWPFNILNPDHFRLLSTYVAEIKPVAVFMDTLREAHGEEEDSSTTMRAVISALAAATQPAALILISHSRKAIKDQSHSLINDQRGSNYVVGRMDAIVRFTAKTVHYTGRAIEGGSIRLERLENGLWSPTQDNRYAHLQAVLADPSLVSISAQAKRLAALLGHSPEDTKSTEACRSFIRRVAR
jgi:RecA-family ATPase